MVSWFVNVHILVLRGGRGEKTVFTSSQGLGDIA